MRKLLSVFIALIGLTLVAVDADAKRVGGGRSVGKQREAISPQQATPRTPPQQAAPAAAPAKQGMSKWLGPLAGLAIGAGLASLFMNNGLGGALAGMLLIAALVAGAIFLVRMLRGTRNPQPPLGYAGANSGPNAGPGTYGRTEPSASPSVTAYTPIGAAPHSVAATTAGAVGTPAQSSWPADFDAEEFVRHAKANFVKLQEAHDRKDLGTIRDFLSPDLAKEIEADIRASGDVPQKTDVITLNGEVLDVTQENGQYVVSTRFSGLIREAAGAEPQPFSEIWHLEKPLNGRSGWQVAGIQQA